MSSPLAFGWNMWVRRSALAGLCLLSRASTCIDSRKNNTHGWQRLAIKVVRRSASFCLRGFARRFALCRTFPVLYRRIKQMCNFRDTIESRSFAACIDILLQFFLGPGPWFIVLFGLLSCTGFEFGNERLRLLGCDLRFRSARTTSTGLRLFVKVQVTVFSFRVKTLTMMKEMDRPQIGCEIDTATVADWRKAEEDDLLSDNHTSCYKACEQPKHFLTGSSRPR